MGTPRTLTKNDFGFDLKFTVRDTDGEIVDLTGATVKFQMSSLDYQNHINADCTPVDPAAGVCKYTVQENDLSMSPGRYWGALEYNKAGKTVSSSQFMIRVLDDVGPPTP